MEFLTEKFLFSDKSLSFDLEDFEKGKKNKLLILGLSGSGKSSLGSYLSHVYKVDYYSLDNCYNDDIKKKLIKKYNLEEKENYSLIYHCIKEKLFSNKKEIIEGIGLIDITDVLFSDKVDSKFRNKLLISPTIILGKSVLKSTFDASLRNKKIWKKSVLDQIFSVSKMNRGLEESMNKFIQVRSKVPGTKIEEFNVPKLNIEYSIGSTK